MTGTSFFPEVRVEETSSIHPTTHPSIRPSHPHRTPREITSEGRAYEFSVLLSPQTKRKPRRRRHRTHVEIEFDGRGVPRSRRFTFLVTQTDGQSVKQAGRGRQRQAEAGRGRQSFSYASRSPLHFCRRSALRRKFVETSQKGAPCPLRRPRVSSVSIQAAIKWRSEGLVAPRVRLSVRPFNRLVVSAHNQRRLACTEAP